MCLGEYFPPASIGTVAMGLAAFWLKDKFAWLRVRRSVLSGLQVEAHSCLDMTKAFFAEERKGMSAVVLALKAGKLTQEILDEPHAGWNVYAPALPVQDFITKVYPDEARAIICYADTWAEVKAFEGQYARYFMQLVDSLEGLEGPADLRRLQYATLAEGSWELFLAAMKRLEERAETLYRIALAGSQDWKFIPDPLPDGTARMGD